MASSSQAPGQDSETRPTSIADGKPRWIPAMPYVNLLGLGNASVGNKIGSHTQLMLAQIRRQRVLDVMSETLPNMASLTDYSSGDNHQLNQISGVRDFANESIANVTVNGKDINVTQAADGDPIEVPSTQKKDDKNRPVPVESASVHQPESASVYHSEIEEHSMKENEGGSNKMQQPKPKRKKLRPKVLREDKPPRAPKSDPMHPVTPKPPKPPKRKYVRKKNVPKPSDVVPTSPMGESVDPENENGIKAVKENEHGIKAVKRRLDFNSEEPCAREGQGRASQIYACNEALNIILPQAKRKQVQETCVSGTLSSSIVISAATSSQEQEVNDEKSLEGTRCSLNTSMDQVPSEYIHSPETPTPPFYPSRKRRSVRINQKHGGNDKAERPSLSPPHPSRRERIHENLKELYLNVTGNSARSPESRHKNQLPPNSSTAVLLRGLKRAYNFVGDNCIQGYKSSACMGDRMGYMIRTEVCSNVPYFPKIYKKKRTQKGLKVAPNADLIVTPSASSNNLNSDRDIAAFERERASWLHRALFNQRQPKDDMTPDLPAQTSKLIPPGITEAWNNLSNRLTPGLSSTQCNQLSTPEKGPGCNISYGSMSYGRQYSYVNWTTKKRTKKEDKHLVRSGPLYRNQISLAGYDSTSSSFSSCGKYHVHSTAQPSRRSPVSRISCRAEKPFQGIPSPSMMVRYEDLLDSIVWKMKSLNIYGIHVAATAETQNALVPYNGGGRILVPYARPMVVAKKQPLRPRVDLDEETTRVWNLLMEKGSTDEGVDVEKDKWWEQERRTVRGRIDSFIARMHLVQGDRRFSRWKGSVVDSVVGVFLTQNVSDHLSSSAFMALAAKYPCRSEENNNSSDAEMSSTSAAQQEVCSVDSDDNLKFQEKMFSEELLYQDFLMTPEVERAADREIGNYNESLGSNSCTTVLDYSIGNHLEIHASEQEVGHQSPGSSKNILVAVTGSISVAETEDKSIEDVVSSKSSIISSQNSSELIVQSDGQTEPISITDMEDLVSGDLHNVFNSSTSFMELLQMAESASFKEMYSNGNLLSEEFYITPDRMAYSEFNKRTSIEVRQDKYKGECPSLHRLNSNCHDMHDELMGVSHASSTSYESRSSRMAATASRMNAIQNDVIKVSGPSGSSSEDVSQQMLSFTSSTSPDTCAQVIKHSVQPLTCSGKGVYMDNQSCCHSIYSKEISEASSCKNTPESSILEGNQRTKLQHEEIGRKHAANAIRAEGHGCDVRQASSGVHQSCLNLNNDSRETVEVVDEIESIKKDVDYSPSNDLASTKRQATRPKKANSGNLKEGVDWDNLRKKSCPNGTKVERSSDTMDSVDWDAVRCADVKEVSETIRDRGMNNVLAGRIKIFLNRLVEDHGSIDLEWLRDIPPESTKDFLLSIKGLGLKSAECVRLLTLHQLAFPVDTNVGRICVRLGWVPLQPLPESLQLHLLELYPVLESIQKYLWPRLCKLDQQTLYELHYQMITFGKVFCTKRQPNCNACPMRAECRHFASAFTSAKKLLTGPEEKGLVRSTFPNTFETAQTPVGKQKVVPQLEGSSVSQQATVCEPIIEEPASPEPEPVEDSIREIEEDFVEDPDEIPHIKLNLEAFTQNIQDFMQSNMKGQEGEMSNALVVLTQEAASIPVPKLKNRKRLRTEHLVYELQDNHPLLEGFNQREPDDPSPYLLAIWSPGETAHSYDQTERRCNSRGPGELCDIITCFACNSVREARTQTVRGTIMIPCRTANKGSFPLNGTYFQVNEVFADHESSLHPIVVPRHWIGSLRRRTVYFGTSVPAIFKGLTTDEIMFCFWKGFVCVRGFDRETGAPRPLYARLHLAASKAKNMKAAEEAAAAAVAAAVAEEARKQKQEEATKQKQQQWRRSRNQM